MEVRFQDYMNLQKSVSYFKAESPLKEVIHINQ